MIGDGPLKGDLENAIETFEVADQVTLLGSCPHETTLRYISESDMLVLTSRIEAYPTVVFEALALETPVIATPVGILPEISQPRLQLSSIAEMPATIEECELESGQGLDSAVLTSYSIDHFVEEVNKSLSKVSESPR